MTSHFEGKDGAVVFPQVEEVHMELLLDGKEDADPRLAERPWWKDLVHLHFLDQDVDEEEGTEECESPPRNF